MNSEETGSKKLYRSQRHKMIAGVCGGLADYFGIDPTWVRLAFVILALFGGWVIVLLYIIAGIIIPKEPPYENSASTSERETQRSKAAYLSGIVLLGFGLFLVFGHFGVLAWKVRPFWGIPWRLIWGLFLSATGVMLFFSHRGSREKSPYGPNAQGRKRLTRIRQGRIIGGVCGGVGRYFDIDPSFVRLVWTLGTIASVGVGGLAYVMMLIFVPEEVPSDTSTGTVE